MIEALAQLLGFSQAALLTGFTVFLRVGAAMALIPAFGEQGVPARIRLGAALAFTAIVAPLVPVPQATSLAGIALSLTLLSEIVIGLTFGFGLRLFIFALQVAGSMAAQSTSLAQIFGASPNVDPQPAIGHLFVVAGLALAATSGLHVQVAMGFVESYKVLPVGAVLGAGDAMEWGVSRVSAAFGMAFSLASPFIIAALIYNIALGVINRAMPQLMVAFVGAPAITAGGLILLFLSTPYLLSLWLTALQRYMATPFGG
ncbi:flagellar biosynthetic protein FliR [Oceanicola sp. 502str15]|uniref:flagellar biosynthetic protein FliR n=1 Tax=Oceanicola sp. 502str15 TaxID=2696061 RepID=UPI0020949F79|nr:flagellar biosynthetic protein FliR [Oceanicola sp. 502str15]MCO6384777.1 type III secretion protein [Oceanicola sp. 502str15]